jgi:purine-nucleoside phosphorylase
MSDTYDPELRKMAVRVARAQKITLRKGVYVALAGPSYETPAEIRAYRKLGADVVGMSTVPEVIAARHAGMRVMAFSCITNLAAGLSADPLSHDEVIKTTQAASGDLARFLEAFLEKVV